MNNEQNNNMFGILNMQQQNQNSQVNDQTIPGANLTPITPNTVETTNQVLQPTMSVNTAPGIVTDSLVQHPQNGLSPINNGNVLVNSASIPGIVNSTSMDDNINASTNNLGSGTLGIDNSINNTMNNQSLNPVMSENNNPNVIAQSMNNNQMPNNSFGDATPLTNQSLNTNDEVVTVKQYILYMLLCCIPLVGFIIMLMKAFGKNENKNISNLAKAQLLLAVIVTAIGFALVAIFGSLLVNILT